MIPVDPEYSVKTQWLAFKGGWKWVLTCALATAVGAGLLSSFQPRIFGAKTLLLVSQSKIAEADSKFSNYVYYELLKTYETLLLNDSLIQKTIEHFGLQRAPYKLNVDTMRPMLRVSLLKSTWLLEINVEFPDRHLAAEIANFFAKEAVNLNEEMNARDRRKAVLFFQREMEEARHNLESSNNRLAEFNKSAGIEKTRELIRGLSKQPSENESKLSRSKVELSEHQARRPVQVAEGNAQGVTRKAEIETSQNARPGNTRNLDRRIEENTAKEGLLSQLSAENSLATENYLAAGRKLREASLSASSKTVDLQQLSPALPSERPIRPRIPLNILLGALFGFLASALLTLLIQNLASPRKKKEEHQVEEKLRDIRRSSKGY